MSLNQRINLKFLVKLKKTPTESLKMLQEAHGDQAMSRARVFKWHRRFRESEEDMEDKPRSGRLSSSKTDENVEAVRQAVRGDRRLTIRMIAEQVGIDRQTVWQMITEELRMQKICAKIVPKLLSDDQKARRMQVCEDTLQNIQNGPELLTKVITGDETWVFEYDPETKRQSKQWLSPGSPRPKKAR